MPTIYPDWSADSQRALHAGVLVAVDRAVELVLAGLEVDRHVGGSLGQGLRLLLHAVTLDLDGVRRAGRVVHDDRDLARLGGQLGLVELERPARIGGQLQLARGAPAPAGALARVGPISLGSRGGVPGAAAVVRVVAPASGGDEGQARENGSEHQHWLSHGGYYAALDRPVRLSSQARRAAGPVRARRLGGALPPSRGSRRVGPLPSERPRLARRRLPGTSRRSPSARLSARTRARIRRRA